MGDIIKFPEERSKNAVLPTPRCYFYVTVPFVKRAQVRGPRHIAIYIGPFYATGEHDVWKSDFLTASERYEVSYVDMRSVACGVISAKAIRFDINPRSVTPDVAVQDMYRLVLQKMNAVSVL
jgi:hypothetical protein